MRRRQVLALTSVTTVGGVAYWHSGRNTDDLDQEGQEQRVADSERDHTGSEPATQDGTGNETERDDENSVLEDSEGMLVFTYDDSPLEDYTLAYEVHQEYGAPGCTAACPGLMEERDAYLDPAQLREMQDDGWGVLSHTYRVP
ncbi:polysaccharide deacetylase family protein [Natronococcus jeotgali]